MPELVNCPHCDKKLRVPDNLLGKAVKCPTCTKTFTAEAEGSAPPPREEEQAPAPPPRRRPVEEESVEDSPRRRRPADEEEEERPSRRSKARDEDDEEDRPSRRPRARDDEEDDRPRRRGRDEDDEDDDRPRRRSRRSEDDDDDFRPRRRRGGRGVAADAVAGPAIGLLVTGILYLLTGIYGIFNFIVSTGVPPPPQADAAFQVGYQVGRIGPAILWPLFGILITLGGVKMKGLQSRGLAVTAAILAMLPCNPCCLLGLGMGIWAVVVLGRDDVKNAFS